MSKCLGGIIGCKYKTSSCRVMRPHRRNELNLAIPRGLFYGRSDLTVLKIVHFFKEKSELTHLDLLSIPQSGGRACQNGMSNGMSKCLRGIIGCKYKTSSLLYCTNTCFMRITVPEPVHINIEYNSRHIGTSEDT